MGRYYKPKRKKRSTGGLSNSNEYVPEGATPRHTGPSAVGMTASRARKPLKKGGGTYSEKLMKANQCPRERHFIGKIVRGVGKTVGSVARGVGHIFGI